MHNNNGQQYDYSKVHQITPEELQKTLVLNLKDTLKLLQFRLLRQA